MMTNSYVGSTHRVTMNILRYLIITEKLIVCFLQHHDVSEVQTWCLRGMIITRIKIEDLSIIFIIGIDSALLCAANRLCFHGLFTVLMICRTSRKKLLQLNTACTCIKIRCFHVALKTSVATSAGCNFHLLIHCDCWLTVNKLNFVFITPLSLVK